MIKVTKDKSAIQIGELVIVKKWENKKGYTYSDTMGIIMDDEGIDENGLERWGRWHVVLLNGDYIGCSSNEISVVTELDDE
jgi:hypothetical protein